MLPLHYSIFFAVRTGIEPVATDRQSVMLAITLTNHCSGAFIDAMLHTTLSRVCIGGQTRTDNLMIPDHGFYQLKYSYVYSVDEV